MDPVTKAAVEATHELTKPGGGRPMLRFRHLFKPEYSPGEIHERVQRCGHVGSVFIWDFFEDENGNELTSQQVATALTGNKTAVMLPPGAKQHDIAYILAEKPPFDISKISLSMDHLQVLGYFERDLREMRSSSFFKEGPGSLLGVVMFPPRAKELRTAVSEEEIRSFVTIFRRLYMRRERANLYKAADVFATAMGSHPAGKWVAAGTADIEATLQQPPTFVPFGFQPRFTVKRLIDIFLYTQYAHQPDECRSRQFQHSLQEVGNDRAVLTFLFLSEIWSTAIRISNVGQFITRLFELYCQQHKPACDIVASSGDAHPGIGALDKAHEREHRILQQQAERLADAMWHEAGQPPGGPQQFTVAALARLRDAMRRG